MFKVGDRVIPKESHMIVGGEVIPLAPNLQQIAVVTEITEKGFRWKLEGDAICIHPFLGSYSEGECYFTDSYRYALDTEKPVLLKDVRVSVTTSDGRGNVAYITTVDPHALS